MRHADHRSHTSRIVQKIKLAAMQFNDPARQRQAQPDPVGIPRMNGLPHGWQA